MQFKETLKNIISALPSNPGIYKYYNNDNELIYIGKAKNIKKRVGSYFNKIEHLDRKTARLVSQIANIEYTIVDTEYDALLLENNLIKAHQPKYNILLKDDKSYPYICITNERFPRVVVTRKYIKGAGTYFGPYASLRTMNTLLELIKKLYTFRTCTLNLTPANIESKKFKVCLEYHIGNCKGPCENLQSENDYLHEIELAAHILKGHLTIAKNYFREKMLEHADKFEFELAHLIKQKLELLDNYQSKSVIYNPDLPDIDVFACTSENEFFFINYLKIVKGIVSQTFSTTIKRKLEETNEELLEMSIIDLRLQFDSQSKDILINLPINLEIPGVTINLPQKGDKRKLLELSIKNVIYFKKEQLDKINSEIASKTDRSKRVLITLKKDLSLIDLPEHIECFDNSNIQGTNPVAAMVCFKNGRPSKKDYRHFNIKTVVGPNDFASMSEIVHRRYTRLIDENLPLPNLIIIDGGKGQLSAACDSLKALNIYGKIPIIGIAKRLEEIYFPEDPLPLYIDKRSESLKLIQQIRDEAHRFAITFHRSQRSKSSLKVNLEEIKGLGPKTIEKIYKEFKSINLISAQNKKELEILIGKTKTEILLRYIENKKGESK